MIFSRALAYAALTVLKWLFLFTSALAAAATLWQWLDGNPEAVPRTTITVSVIFGALGLGASWAADRFMRMGHGS